MKREHVRDESPELPIDSEPDEVTALRIWHCKYRSLGGLAQFKNLRTLIIATYPDPDLAPLASLTELRYLSITHLPHVSDLAPLGGLPELRVLRLETLASWDSSGRVTTVDSLQPLAMLPNLAHLELLGVRPESRSLAALESSDSLKTARVSKFPKMEVRRFREATGLGDAWAPPPGVADW